MMAKQMQNKHLEHPEDCILTGDMSVLDWMCEANSTISVKIDGAPAIVWGTNPANGKFFVGTKSVFNKVKIKIAHSHSEIAAMYEGKVAEILHACFNHLPRTESIIQGDFIGFGGLDTYRPNTITYKFSQIVNQDILVAPHTIYSGGNDLRNVSAAPLNSKLLSTDSCFFVQPEASINRHREDIVDICKFARQMSMMCEFVNDKQAAQLKKIINSYVREGKEVNEYEIAENAGVDVNVLRLWKLVQSIKMDLFFFIDTDDSISCKIGNNESDHEGYVMSNQFGTYKIVDRDEFSRLNFTIAKQW